MEPNTNSEKKTNEQIYNNDVYYEETDKNFPLDLIFTNLDNISKINVGDKLTHDSKYITIDTSYVKSISRMFYGVSRNTNLDFINKILSESYKHLNILRRNNDNISGIMWIKLISRLKISLNGLVKLRQTYSFDEEFTKQLDITIKQLCKYS
jgi:hypothetical protein